MFGTIVSPPAPIEVDVDTLVSHIIGMALIHRDAVRYHERAEGAYSSANESRLSAVARDLVRESRRQMFAATSPLRCAIGHRTQREREQAEATVRAGDAWFVTPACSGEDCMDCELPLWHHIVLLPPERQRSDRRWTTRVLCPFGREFWTLARAIHEREGRHGTEPDGCPLVWIAKRG